MTQQGLGSLNKKPNNSMWVDVDDTWCYCKVCGKYHSKPFFRKTQYCPDCGAYMQNYKRGE